MGEEGTLRCILNRKTLDIACGSFVTLPGLLLWDFIVRNYISNHLVLAEIYSGVLYIIGAGIPQAWCPRDYGLFSSRDKAFISSPECPNCLLIAPSLLFIGCLGLFP
jgi:hypothetical protein